jgi:hypothetical protein
MAEPASAVTISRAAEILGEDEELLWDLVDQMVYGTADQHTIAFTEWRLENLREPLAEHKRRQAPPRP